MTTVYFLKKIACYSNAYAVNRFEEWALLEDKTFLTEKQALDYLKEKHRYNPEFINLACNVKDKDGFLEEFSYKNDMYYPKRLYFIGKKNEIREKLIYLTGKEGIKIILK
jgi:hypothetical protein